MTPQKPKAENEIKLSYQKVQVENGSLQNPLDHAFDILFEAVMKEMSTVSLTTMYN